MTVYTRPERNQQPTFETNDLNRQTSPTLIFQKWQAYDRFEPETDHQGRTLKAFETEKSRREYLPNIAHAVHSVYSNEIYRTWYEKYIAALKIKGAQSLPYETVWRLLLGYGTNPTLESGIMLHHLYGFPYIPGSEVKGLLHHVAEMQVMEGIEDNKGNKSSLSSEVQFELESTPPDALVLALAYLKRVKALFGSIHLERGEMEIDDAEPGRKKKIPVGLKAPLEVLRNWDREIETEMRKTGKDEKSLGDDWKRIRTDLKWLLGGQIGGILRFYDAVPAIDQAELLQLDVLTPHYKKYYEDKNGTISPSDDQSPNPILFLAVRPGAIFEFFFQSDFEKIKAAHERNKNDKEAEQIIEAINGWAVKDPDEQVKDWLKIAITEYGIGAKTAAGYGYFKNPDEQESAIKNKIKSTSKSLGEDTYGKKPLIQIQAIQPQPFVSKVKPAQKAISGITKQFNQEKWNKIINSEYVIKVEGKAPMVVKEDIIPQIDDIKKNGFLLKIKYKNGNVLCPVDVTLQGISNEGEAQWVWEKEILPILNEKKE